MAAVIKDIKKQIWMCVLYSLALLSDGIMKYFQDQFTAIHKKLMAQNQHLNMPCTISCSKNHQDQKNWCVTCSSWKTSILSLHRNPNARKGNIDWKQFDSSKWPTDPMEVKKCFEPEWRRAPGSNPNLFDISIIIGCMSNCSHFRLDTKPIRDIRNDVSHNNHLTKQKKKGYCQTLLDFLQHADIWNYKEAKDAFNDILVFKDTTLEMIFENNLLDEQRLNEIESRLFSRETFIEQIISVIISKKDILCAVLFVILGVLCVKMYNKKEECDFGYKTEFKSYLDQHNNFTGREWLFKGIKERLNSSERGLILVADLGYGKTAAVTQIINKKHNIGDFDIFPYLCRSDVRTLQQAASFLLHLFQHLLCNYPSFRNTVEEKVALSTMKDLENSCKYDPLYFLDRVILDNLMKMEPPIGSDLLVLVDALDECQSKYKDVSILSVLQLRHKNFPRWVRFILTSRNNSVILSEFNSLSQWHLTKNSDENKKDVSEFVQNSYLVTASTANKFSSHLEYNFLFTMYAVSDKHYKQDEASLPRTLHDAFKKEMNRLFDNCNPTKFKKSRFMLEVLVASFQHLKIDELFSFVSASDVQFSDKYEFEELLQNMRPHILQIAENGEITLFHSSLADWLTQLERRGHPCFVDRQNGYKTITRALIKKIMISSDEADYDSVNWLINYLSFANDTALLILFKELPMGIVDKTMCCESLNRTVCLSCLDQAAKCFNSYKLFKTILSLSETKNTTLAAGFSVMSNNIDSLRAIIEYGHVDVSARGEMFDLTRLDYERDKKKYKEKDAFTILHFAISHKNVKAFQLIVDYNTKALQFETRSGYSVLQLTVLSADFEILKLCLEYVQIEEDILPLAAYFADDRSIELLLQHGAKDSCLKCEKDIFIRENREIYFAKYNKTISIDEKRYLKDNGEINHYIDSDIFQLTKDITCECVLHIAVRHGNVNLVQSILRQSVSTIECVDFQGITPLAGTVIFKQHNLFDYLLQNGANVNFFCEPTDIVNRINMLRQLKVYSLLYDDLHVDEYCPKGASIGHLISLNPTCETVKIILRKVDITQAFKQRDQKNRNPLFYLLCQTQKWDGFYFDSDDLVSEQYLQLLLFLMASQQEMSDSSRLLTETGVFGNKLQISNANILQTICSYSPDMIPDIDKLFIKVNAIMHKRENIAKVFPIEKEVILKIMYNLGVQKTETIISITVSPHRDYSRNVRPPIIKLENIAEISFMSHLLEKIEQTAEELDSLKKKTSKSGSEYKMTKQRLDLNRDIIVLLKNVLEISNKWKMLFQVGVNDDEAVIMKNLMEKGLKLMQDIKHVN